MEHARGIRLLCCGDRHWADKRVIRRELTALERQHGIALVIHGGQVTRSGKMRFGADYLAGEVAEAMGYEVLVFPADWARYHRGAGPRRNQQMLVEGQPDFVLAFHPDLALSLGTKDMVTRARQAGIPTKVVKR